MVILMPIYLDWTKVEGKPNSYEYDPSSGFVHVLTIDNLDTTAKTQTLVAKTYTLHGGVTGSTTQAPDWSSKFATLGDDDLVFTDNGGTVTAAVNGSTTWYWTSTLNGGTETFVRSNPTDVASREYKKHSNVTGRHMLFTPYDNNP